MSASWDDDREGSGLGVDEFQKNVGSLREGLSRTKGEFYCFDTSRYISRIVWDSIRSLSPHLYYPLIRFHFQENALLREKMAGLSEDEIQRAIDGQERREKAKNKKDAWME